MPEDAAGFERFPLADETLDALDAMGYASPTPVQASALGALLGGADAVMEAPTGTGKTAAFGIALVERTPADEEAVALVLVPTRELATQVAEEVTRIGTTRGYRAFPITGGVREAYQVDRMAGASCLVATPGRLLDLLEKHEITLAGVRFVVIDEVDRMLDEGFLPDVERILAAAPTPRQTVITSATLPDAVMDLAAQHLVDARVVRIGDTVSDRVQHYRWNVKSGEKTAALLALLKHETFERALVFMRTRANVDATAKDMRARGTIVDPLHGQRDAFQRRHVMDLLRRGATKVVLATDVAARGIDVPEIDFVVNFDPPENGDTYMHRAGRTGRLGRSGKVVTLITAEQKLHRERLEHFTGFTLLPYKLPGEKFDPRAYDAPQRPPPGTRPGGRPGKGPRARDGADRKPAPGAAPQKGTGPKGARRGEAARPEPRPRPARDSTEPPPLRRRDLPNAADARSGPRPRVKPPAPDRPRKSTRRDGPPKSLTEPRAPRPETHLQTRPPREDAPAFRGHAKPARPNAKPARPNAKPARPNAKPARSGTKSGASGTKGSSNRRTGGGRRR